MYRERLTITLDADLLTAIDGLIDKETLRNRSQTIEHLLKEGIGLHQLTQAFVFVNEDFSQAQLKALSRLFAASSISSLFLCIPSSLQSQTSELSALLLGAYRSKAPAIRTVPSDFGTGGALLLVKDELTTPFAVATVTTDIPLPDSLAPSYIFHRSHHGSVTELVAKSESGYRETGVSLCSPDLLDKIPGGIVDLQKSVFPELVKDGRVKGYIYSA